MALPAFADIEDFERRIPGGIAEEDRPRAQAALDDASSLIRECAGKTWTHDQSDVSSVQVLDDDVPDIVATVCMKAARRSYLNPDDLSREQIDDYVAEYRPTSADVYLTRQEQKMIRKAAGRTGVWTQRTYRGEAPDVESVYVEDSTTGAEPIAYQAQPDPY